MPNLWIIFTTGLLTGGLTCLAVQGGLLATTITQRQALTGPDKKDGVMAVLLFLAAKLLAYTLLGVLLGWLGSLFSLSVTVLALLQAGVALFMVGTALGMLEVHPLFRYFILQPPKFLTRLVRSESKSSDAFAPVILGLLTVFIPCGTTQAMMALALSTGSPLGGALVLFAFVLGTSPLFFVFGYLASSLRAIFADRFQKVAAATVLVVAVWSFNGALGLLGSPLNLESVAGNIYCTLAFCGRGAVLAGAQGRQASREITLSIGPTGYSVDHTEIPSGSLITMHLHNDGGRGCQQVVTIPKLGIRRIVRPGDSDTLTFNSPKEPGELTLMCSMGMYRQTLQVI